MKQQWTIELLLRVSAAIEETTVTMQIQILQQKRDLLGTIDYFFSGFFKRIIFKLRIEKLMEHYLNPSNAFDNFVQTCIAL